MITELTQRGFHIGTVNHHSRAGFEIDQPGKDSWRHAQAGRRQVVIAAPDKIAIYWLLDRELTLDEIVSQFKDVDIILVEGYKQAGQPSIEIVRGDLGVEFLVPSENLIAVVTNVTLNKPVPQYGFQDFNGVADQIETSYLLPTDN